jgi:predicted HTH domain antitoxin
MPVVQVEFETDVFATLRRSPEEIAQELRLGAAVRWYALGLVSQEKGAEIAGLSRAEFIDALSASGVSPVQETLDEIREALARG